MRAMEIYRNGVLAGLLSEENRNNFVFRYEESYFNDNTKPAISLTLPKNEKEFHAKYLFPFFYNMLPEGSNKQVVCKLNRIDQEDYFGLLMISAKDDSIGAVTVRKIDEG
jgi:serine/threonine-protein kinase HipA